MDGLSQYIANHTDTVLDLDLVNNPFICKIYFFTVIGRAFC